MSLTLNRFILLLETGVKGQTFLDLEYLHIVWGLKGSGTAVPQCLLPKEAVDSVDPPAPELPLAAQAEDQWMTSCMPLQGAVLWQQNGLNYIKKCQILTPDLGI